MHSNRFEMAHRESCVPTAPKRSRFKHSAFHSQRLYIQALTNSFALSLSHPRSASVSPTGSHTSKDLHIYIKTMGFKPPGITYLREAFSQTLLNHILPKIGVGGGGASLRPNISPQSRSQQSQPSTSQHSPASCRICFPVR